MTAAEQIPAFVAPEPIPAAEIERRRAELLTILRDGADAGPYHPNTTSLSAWAAPAWFRDAKFGIFIHWLASSVAAAGSDWYPRHMYISQHPDFQHHRSHFGDQTEFGYKDFLPGITGELFDPHEWVQTIKDSGAQYVIPVAEHHDGYSFYDNTLTRWNSLRIGPGRDIVGDLLTAAREEGLRVGVASHRAENWWFFNGGTRFPSDVQDEQWRDLYGPAQPWSRDSPADEAWVADWAARTTELVEKYDPDLLYFDFEIDEAPYRERLREIAALLYNKTSERGESGILCYKWEALDEGTALRDIERGAVRMIQREPFQNDTSISRICWSYLEDNEFKPVDEILVDLIDTVSKNGNLLLNIGPKPDGSLDEREVAILRSIGAWLETNGEAVYGTRPWIAAGEGPTHPVVGSFADRAPIVWTGQDLRFTTKGDILYATWLARPQGTTLRIVSLGSDLQLLDVDVTEVRILGVDAPVTWRRTSSALEIELPDGVPDGLGVARIHLQPVPLPVREEEDLIV